MGKVKSEIAIPAVILAVGIGWLVNSLDVIPDVNWVWSLGLGAAGALVLATGGINKGTVVIGPLLLIVALLSVARQTGGLELKLEVPLLIIALGGLSLFSALSGLPTGFDEKKQDGPPRT